MFVKFLDESITVVPPILRFAVPEPDAPFKLTFVPEISTVFADVPIYSAPVPIPPYSPIFVLLCAESRSIASEVLEKLSFPDPRFMSVLLFGIVIAVPPSVFKTTAFVP